MSDAGPCTCLYSTTVYNAAVSICMFTYQRCSMSFFVSLLHTHNRDCVLTPCPQSVCHRPQPGMLRHRYTWILCRTVPSPARTGICSPKCIPHACTRHTQHLPCPQASPPAGSLPSGSAMAVLPTSEPGSRPLPCLFQDCHLHSPPWHFLLESPLWSACLLGTAPFPKQSITGTGSRMLR